MASVPLGSSTRNGTSKETVLHLAVLTWSRPCYGSARNRVVFVSYDSTLVPQSDSPDPEACRSDREINLHDYHYNLTCLIYFTLSTFNGVRKCGSAISQCWYQLPLVRRGHCISCLQSAEVTVALLIVLLAFPLFCQSWRQSNAALSRHLQYLGSLMVKQGMEFSRHGVLSKEVYDLRVQRGGNVASLLCGKHCWGPQLTSSDFLYLCLCFHTYGSTSSNAYSANADILQNINQILPSGGEPTVET